MNFKGVPLYKAQSSIPANAIFDDPAKLLEACLEYFKWNDENPLAQQKVGFSQGEAVHTTIYHPRAMTSSALSMFLGITHQTLIEWKKTRSDLKPVIDWVESYIWNQKYCNAAAGLLSPNIIARELGLADKKIHTVSAPAMIIKPPGGEPEEAPPIHGE